MKSSEPQQSKIYQLSVNEKQIRLLQQSLDFYSRITAGQLSEISRVIRGDFDRVAVAKWLDLAKLELFPDLKTNEHHSVSRSEESKISYEMMSIIRRHLAFERHPEGGFTVDFDEPLKVSQEPLIEVKIL